MSGITEIAGEAGAAKTQLALQLMLQSPLPQGRGGLCGGAIYLHGDTASCAPALKRLDTLAEAFAERHQDIGATAHRVKEMVYVMQVDSPDELWKIVHEKVPTLAAQTHIRLLVIDSVGGLYRTAADEAAAASGQQRASDKPLSSESRRTAAPWELGPCISSADGQSVRVPALGAAWACCVNTRIVLTRTPVLATGREYESGGAGAGGRSSWHRQLHVAWSPRVAETSVAFEVRDEGLVGLV
jgi:DNA-repair protein XRCC3